MLPKMTVYIASSLDGLIARPDGSLDWLELEAQAGEDYGYQQFFDTVDAMIMGRKTFEVVSGFGQWPYQDKRVIVLSGNPQSVEIPAGLEQKVEVRSAEPLELARALAAEGVEHIYVDGGKTIQAFLQAGLVNTLIISQIPVLIGNGIPLFGHLDKDIRLQHRETRSWPNGLVQSHYFINRQPDF